MEVGLNGRELRNAVGLLAFIICYGFCEIIVGNHLDQRKIRLLLLILLDQTLRVLKLIKIWRNLDKFIDVKEDWRAVQALQVFDYIFQHRLFDAL